MTNFSGRTFTRPTILSLSSDPVATMAADAARRATLVQPTVKELVTLATAGTDFFGEITLSCDTMALAADYADYAAERWEDARDEQPGAVLLTLIKAVRGVLLRLADDVIEHAEADALATRLNAEADRYGVACDYT